MKKILCLFMALCLTVGMIPAAFAEANTEEAHTIVLRASENADGTWSHTATMDGNAVPEYDYTWNVDPSVAHQEVKNAPAEYYTGTEPGDEAVYIAHDIYYWPELPVSGFQRVNYDGEQEWVYYYTDGENNDYIFGTLPVEGNDVPANRMHSGEEAYSNAVLHITQAGTYILEGDWHGQIWIDLGDSDDTFTDLEAKVTVILNGVDVTCTVAPAIVFYSVYECDNTWEDREEYSPVVDTTDAGANVIIADGTVNNFSGTNIYRMLKTAYKSGQEGAAVPVQKKMRKTDGAFYSYVSMNVSGGQTGTGVLNINSEYEGLDAELHLTINGGNINIFADNDGINVNEDGVSVVTVNGGSLHILAGLGLEGDGIDSNGYLMINGGTVISIANPNSDSGMDSDMGSYINGGTVVALGSTMDWAEADDSNDSGQVTMNLQFSGAHSSDEAIIVTDLQGTVVFAYDPDQDEVAGTRTRSYRGAILSFPELTVGQSYYLYVGGDVYGTETAGVYDASTVTGFSEDARQQGYAGSWENWGGGFRRGDPNNNGQMPDGDFDPRGGDGQMPDGDFDPRGGDGQMPDGDFDPRGGDGQMPDGDFDPRGGDGQMPDGDFDPRGGDDQMPGDGNFAPGQFGGQRPGDGKFDRDPGAAPGNGFGGSQDISAQNEFLMEDQVNNFGSISDYLASAE